ncbi:MAG: carbamoyltransferase N-terminal domain-containing protein [Candidatus Bathyarchaeia archaeon]|jgi:carbamoyltransferase
MVAKSKPITLGISCFYHDAAAAIVCNGEIIACVQEERFTRRKYDPSFPINSIAYCFEEAEILACDLDTVVFYDEPALAFDRLINTYLAVSPRGLKSWLTSMPRWISQKLHIPSIIRESLGYEGPILFMPHHLAHAASAFFPSPYEEAAIITVDGVGEWATASYGIGEGSEVRILKEMHFPDSLGLLYSAFTYFCGFKVNSGEYKLMGLAPYGEPKYLGLLKERIAVIHDDGSIELNLDYFGYLDQLEMTSPRFDQLFDGPRRMPESPITRREMDLAASIQTFAEEAMLKMANWVHKETGNKYLCLAGGVALNCVANGRILREGPFEDLWIQPAAGDAGGALGAALAVQFGYHGVKREASVAYDRQKGSYLGPSYSENEVEAFLRINGYPYRRLDPNERAIVVAQALAEGRVVGFFSGRMEYGPRALGARSILGNPLREDTQRIMNLKIKYRESFRPFAPAVNIERVNAYFELDKPSPYMLLVAPVQKSRWLPRASEIPEDGDLLPVVSQKRSDIPAVTHYDYSARIQTVHPQTNPLFHEVIRRFEELTGYALLVNTSFNVRGEPIICTLEEAYRCFSRTEMDCLYLEGFWLDKKDQPKLKESSDNWKEEFVLD